MLTCDKCHHQVTGESGLGEVHAYCGGFFRMSQNDYEVVWKSPSGAASSGKLPRYDLIPAWALERMAQRFTLGAEKYGDNNWLQGVADPVFLNDRFNHAVEHLYKFKAGGSTDDDLAAVILNCIFLMGGQRV